MKEWAIYEGIVLCSIVLAKFGKGTFRQISLVPTLSLKLTDIHPAAFVLYFVCAPCNSLMYDISEN